MMFKPTFRSVAISACLMVATASQAQLRMASWNITNWYVTSQTDARIAAFKKSIYDSYQGRSMSPDIMFISEIGNASSLAAFVTMLNNYVPGITDWTSYTFVSGVDTQSACVYRTSKIVPAGPTVTVAIGSSDPANQPRNTYRFDFYPAGYVTPAALMSVYDVHLKAGSTSSDESRRLVETQRIRADANSLSARGGIMVCGDFNIDSSSAGSYQELIGSQINNAGQVFDPIKTPGSWADNAAFKYVQTQDQWVSSTSSTNVGIDDRYDFMLMDAKLLDGQGLQYIGNPNLAYSTTTWNDPNHSYRCWGNDGSSWIGSQSRGLTVTGNTFVGPTIAQALIDSTGNQSGHLPIVANFRVPPVAATDTVNLDFGLIGQGFTYTLPVQVNDNGDLVKWGADGVADLTYSFNTTGNFYGPSGTFTDRADDGPKTHQITVNTTNPGRINGTVTITTNDPLRPSITVNCTALVAGRITRPNSVPH